MVAAWSGVRGGSASTFMDEPHFLSQDTDHGSLDLQLSSRLPRSLAECAVPFPCTPVLYFSTTTVGPSETASFDKFPLGTGDSLVCDSTSSSIITLGGFKANCRKVVQDVIFDYASPDGYRKRRVEPPFLPSSWHLWTRCARKACLWQRQARLAVSWVLLQIESLRTFHFGVNLLSWDTIVAPYRTAQRLCFVGSKIWVVVDHSKL